MPARIALWICAIAFAISLMAALGIYRDYSDKFVYDFSFVFFPSLMAFGALLVFLKLHANKIHKTIIGRYAPYPIDETLSLSTEGIEIENRFGRGQVRWIAVHHAVEQENHVAIVMNSMMVFVVPDSAFNPSIDKATFVQEIRLRIQQQT